MKRYAVFMTVFAGLLAPCQAQLSNFCKMQIIAPTADGIVQRLKEGKVDRAKSEFKQALTSADTIWACAGNSDRKSPDKKIADIFELRRIDKQVGATSGGSGSTNLVPSGSIPALLGLAVEYGGLTEAFSGTTVTFRTTPAKLLGAMANAYGSDVDPPDDKTLLVLQRVGVSVSFDTSRTSTASTNAGSQLLANYQQLSQASVRILLLHDRDPLSSQNWQKIREFSKSPLSQDLADSASKITAPLTLLKILSLQESTVSEKCKVSASAFDLALCRAVEAFKTSAIDTPDADALKIIFTKYFEEIQEIAAGIPDWQARLDNYTTARLDWDKAHKNIFRQIAKAPSFSFEYEFTRPPSIDATSTTATIPPTAAITAPDLSTASLVYVASLYESEYTLNATARFFNEARPSMSGNFRDFQLAGKWDIPLGRLPSSIAKGILTLSGLYEHLHQKPLGIDLLINDQKVNQPGNIGVFQAKYTIPLGDSGMQVPISFTASNRTELIQEKEVRGNIGITFDLDKLFSQSR